MLPLAADGGYNGWQVVAAVAKVQRLRMEIGQRNDDMRGLVVLPRRWVVERTFCWFECNRRLAKNLENVAETLGGFVAPRLLPACSQPARHGVGRELNKPPVGNARCRRSANRIVKGPSTKRPPMARLRR